MANLDMNDKELMQDIAFLVDRILINTNQKQVFGTQLNGKFVTPKTIDPKNLDLIRKKFRLEPMEKYIERVKDFSGMKEE